MGSLGLIATAFTGALALGACTNWRGVEPTTEDSSAALYADVGALFDKAIAPTCTLNNGVCHNSNTYPDLHTMERVIETANQPCNVDVTEPLQVNDACELPADHLIAPGVDARIVHASLPASQQTLDTSQLTQITLVLDTPPIMTSGTTSISIHRGSTTFDVGMFGAKVSSVSGTTVVLDLGSASSTTKAFFDVRLFPPGALHLHVGDVNGNGIEGAISSPMTLVTPGDPDHSYLLRRLIDPDFGEEMPRQCRTWSDAANRAIACWIAGLNPDLSNAYDPIDYDSCTIDVAGLGKCGSLPP